MKFSNDAKKKITSVGLIGTMLLSSACSSRSNTQTSTVEPTSTAYETSYVETQDTEIQTTEVTDITEAIDITEVPESVETEPVFTYETTIIKHEVNYCQLLPYISDCYMYWGLNSPTNLVGLGMDNPYLQAQINDVLYQNTGTYYDVTIDDVAYLSYATPLSGNSDLSEMSNLYSGFIMSRVILSRLGLRFGIDEIPWWFVEQNFGDIVQGYLDGSLTTPEHAGNLSGFPRYEFFQQDISIRINMLTEIIQYNNCRANIATDEQSAFGKIQIARDTLTGNIILIPSESQYNKFNNKLNNLDSFSDMDIYQVESEEKIFSDVGEDPAQYPSTLAFLDSLNYTK